MSTRLPKITVEETVEDGVRVGVEVEQSDPDITFAEIGRPFDPDKIKVARETKTISLLTTRIDHNEVDLAPEFQRRARIWDLGRKSRLIESILLRIPLPVFYVASDAQESWSVVDGLQRLTTIHDYLKNEYQLKGLEYLVQFEGRTFTELPRNMQRRIEETELVINVIQPGTPEEVMFNIFSRINTGGMTLNAQEIRHALNKGPARGFLAALASSGSFLKATDGSVNDTRMSARECALRFLAFFIDDWRSYGSSDLDGFLNAAMQRVNRLEPNKLGELEKTFDDAMETSFAIFGTDGFRKRYEAGAGRNPVSKALFETWSVTLAKLNHFERQRLIDCSHEVREGFMEMLNLDREFEISISYSTGSPNRVRKRFESIEWLVHRIIR